MVVFLMSMVSAALGRIQAAWLGVANESASRAIDMPFDYLDQSDRQTARL
ncbi:MULTISPECIES: hypothetical protein [unclassified Lysobacter]